MEYYGHSTDEIPDVDLSDLVLDPSTRSTERVPFEKGAIVTYVLPATHGVSRDNPTRTAGIVARVLSDGILYVLWKNGGWNSYYGGELAYVELPVNQLPYIGGPV